MNFALWNKLSFLEFFFAILRALNELSIPIPYEFFNSFNIDSSIQPEPVPISKIFKPPFPLNLLITCSTIISVSGLGIKTFWLILKSKLQNSFFFCYIRQRFMLSSS